MPGIFGGIGCAHELYARLHEHFSKIWNKCDIFTAEGVCIGGHAHGGVSSVYSIGDVIRFAVDGEGAIYRTAAKIGSDESALFIKRNGEYHPSVTCKGNVAIHDVGKQTLYLVTEWSGFFPLYYTQFNGGMLFSSHMKPLAHITNAVPDPVGEIQFLRNGYILAGRTLFKGYFGCYPGKPCGTKHEIIV